MTPASAAFIHTTACSEARIKWTWSHKPFFHTRKTNKVLDEPLTAANRAFIQKVLNDTYANEEADKSCYAYVRPDSSTTENSAENSLLKSHLKPWSRGKFDDAPYSTRVGLMGRKIGVVPMWRDNGKPFLATMLHIEDNHVIRYISPEDFEKTTVAQRRIRPGITKPTKSIGWPSLVVGALSGDPSNYTKDYCGLFTDSGVMPKKLMARFPVSPNAVIQPGTPLFASHFQPGQFIDVKGKSSRRGYQGVMKRYGFSGQPQMNTTKSHRRPGCIGSGRDKGRVWPGQKMPGHVGNKMTSLIGLKIVRINYKYNVIYVMGPNIPGEPGEMIKIFDSKVTSKQLKSPKHFPTCYPEDHDQLPEEEYAEGFHDLGNPSIVYK